MRIQKMKLKESVGEQYEIDISPIQNDGDEMLSFQEMLEDVLEHAGMDNISEIDEEFFNKKYQYFLHQGFLKKRKTGMRVVRCEDDEAWMLAMRASLNNDLSMLNDNMIYDYYKNGLYSERDDDYKAIWDKCVHEIEKKKPDEGRFYDRFDFTTPRVDESKRVNKKRIQESREEVSFQGGFAANIVYVGDPCYCLNDVIYQDAIDQADPEGKFDSIASGAHVEGAFVDTAQGDGEYEGSDGRSYSVDAGIIGIVNITNASATEGEDFQSFSKLGRVIKLPKYAATQYEISRDRAGVITVNIKQGRFNETIEIPTGFAEEYTCNECGEPISEWEYRRYGGCCESCYRESMYGSDDDDEF